MVHRCTFDNQVVDSPHLGSESPSSPLSLGQGTSITGTFSAGWCHMFTKDHRASWKGFALCFFCSPVSSSECKSLLAGLPVSGSSTAFCRPAPGCQCWANITPRLERSRAVDDLNWSQPISIEIRWQDFAPFFYWRRSQWSFYPFAGS